MDAQHPRATLVDRLLGRTRTNGKQLVPAGVQSKGLRFSLSSSYLQNIQPDIQFFSPDGMKTIYRLFGDASSESERVSRDTAFAAAAYLFIAVRYRMKKVAEAPLIVVQEDQEDGSQEWLPDHAIAELLEEPSPDFDMGELLQRTQAAVDISGQALWVKDQTRGGMVGRLTPFSGHEFQVESDNQRIFANFKVELATGPKDFAPDDVVYFYEVNPGNWLNGHSLVDVCLGWLNLSQQARAICQDILSNALFPSVIIQADPEWNPDDPEYEKWKQDLSSYADRDKRGGPMGLIGGGTATRVGLTLRDLIPGDILDRVESVISAVFGIPTVVLQYQIGIENSPWSQMAQARRMAYEDTIEPLWKDYERRLTRQLLRAPVSRGGRPLDDDRSHLIVFDTSSIRALQVDRVAMAGVVGQVATIASVNERRMMVGLEPSDMPGADDIPELMATEGPLNDLPLDDFDNPFGSPEDVPDDTAAEDTPEDEEVERSRRRLPFRLKQRMVKGRSGPTSTGGPNRPPIIGRPASGRNSPRKGTP